MAGSRRRVAAAAGVCSSEVAGGAPATNRTCEEARKRGRRGLASRSPRREAPRGGLSSRRGGGPIGPRRGRELDEGRQRELELGFGGQRRSMGSSRGSGSAYTEAGGPWHGDTRVQVGLKLESISVERSGTNPTDGARAARAKERGRRGRLGVEAGPVVLRRGKKEEGEPEAGLSRARREKEGEEKREGGKRERLGLGQKRER
jgi:hypothetical protein